MCLNLIWAQNPNSLAEKNWIRWLFQDLNVTEHVVPNLDLFKENSIYIIGRKDHPLSWLPNHFLEGLDSVKQKGLFQISDECYSGGYSIYSKFDFVLRNYYSLIFEQPGVMVLPLGFTTHSINQRRIVPATERALLWSFAGAKTAARLKMYKAFKSIDPNACYFYENRKHQKPALDREAFMGVLAQTVFSPCPMGNVVLETFRLYESLEMGCIPIVECRPWMPYFDRLMPGHPLPKFFSWYAARSFVETLLKDKHRLADYQSTLSEWWCSYKMTLQNEVKSFISRGLKGSFRSSLTSEWRCRTGIEHQIWRRVELLKHSNIASLQERIGITAKRIVDRVL